MRKKELKLIVTFHTNDVPGRLIPVPREISAGCGLAWCALPDQRENILLVMEKKGIEQENLHEIIF